MHIAHTAITPQKTQARLRNEQKCSIRYQAYLAACKKHQREIIAIQKYLPGWVPPFETEQIDAE